MKTLSDANLSPAATGLRRWASALLAACSFTCLSLSPGSAEVCQWRGTAPFCNGSCLSGETTKQTVDQSNDPRFGKACQTGNKTFCCKPDPVAAPATCVVAGVERTDIAEADCQEAQTTGCIRHRLTDAGYKACLSAQPGAVAEKTRLCEDYARRMVPKAEEVAKLKCPSIDANSYNKNYGQFRRHCLEDFGASPAATIAISLNGLDSSIAECKKQAGGVVKAATTAYSDASGNGAEVCFLAIGDTVTVVGHQNSFTKISGASGNCKGKQGFVFDGDHAL